MVIKKKVSEESREKFISKGAGVKKEKKPWTRICLRIPQEMVDQIDILIEKKVGFNRTSWILKSLETQIKWDR